MTASNLAIGSIAPQTYQGIYVRNNLVAQGTVPEQPPFNLCPDIIHSDSQVPANTFATPASWQQMYSTDPIIGAQNFYYVRGKNGASAPDTGTMALYWAPAQVFNFPAAWKGNALTTLSGGESSAVSASGGNIAVGDEPFVWTPASVPFGSSYFNFVCQSVDRANPNPIPTIGSWLDLSNLLSNKPGFGFRNTAVVDGAAPSWMHRQMLSVPANFSPAQLQLVLSAQGFTGTTVGLLCDMFTPSGQVIAIDPVNVVGDGIIVGTTATMEPGYQTSLAIVCWNPSGSLSPGSSLTLSMTYAVQTGADLEFAMTNGLLRYQHEQGIGSSRIGPTPVATVASITFMVGAPLQSALHR